MRHSLYANNRKSEVSRSFKASRTSLEQFSGKKIRTAKQSNALNVLEIATACQDKKQILTLKTEIKNYLSNIIKKAEV